MVRKNSVLLEHLDNLILRVIEAGLGANWENQVKEKIYINLNIMIHSL